MTNINNNKRTILDLKLKNDEYWDVMLSKDLLNSVSLKDIESQGLASFIDFSDSRCFLNNESIKSLLSWRNAINEGVTLNNIGLTGIDNGFIKYRKDRISNKEFLNLFLNSTFDIPQDDNCLFLTPVCSNTLAYHIPLPSKNEDYVKFDGGFYQGFFKIHENDYQVLPHYLNNEWNIFFRLRPCDYPILEKSLNDLYPNNKGMFFYIGTRAENKFWELYNKDKENVEFSLRDSYSDNGYFVDDYGNVNVLNEHYLMNMSTYECEECNGYFDEGYFEDDIIGDSAKNYFTDDYFDTLTPEHAIVDEYTDVDIPISDIELQTISDYDLDKRGYYEIETDNKFLLFNRTDNGCTVDTWDENANYVFTGRTDCNVDNYYLLFNQTPTGYTVNTINEYIENHKPDYDVYSDVYNNALGFKINDDGSIGYRYLILDCNSDGKLSVIEETSKPNIVHKNEWHDINIKMKLLNFDNSECNMSKGKGIMKIYIYVNGFLKFISQELPELSLKPLNDISDKQEGVPYNISIGGGSQGLMDTIGVDYYKISQYILPIEKNFAGTFMGDISKFKFYDSSLSLYEIQHLNN